MRVRQTLRALVIRCKRRVPLGMCSKSRNLRPHAAQGSYVFGIRTERGDAHFGIR